MNNLITIENGEVKINSLMIAEHFGKEHAHVMRDIRDEIEKLETAGVFGQSIFGESSYINQQNKPQPCYTMGKRGALQIAARYDAVARYQLIEKIEELEHQSNNRIPQNFSEALRLAANLQEENELLKLTEEKNLPKVMFANAVEAMVDSILMRDLAKLLKKNGVNIGQNRLYDWMRENGFVQKTANRPTQKAVDLGVLELKEGIRFGKNQEIKPTWCVKVTGKGQIYFINKFKTTEA